MPEISCYYHCYSPIEKVLPKLLEKVLQVGKRAVVCTGNRDHLAEVDKLLWTYSKSELLPHGTEEDGNAEYQPIWVTTKEENPNAADFLFILGNQQPSNLEKFERVFVVSDNWDVEYKQWLKALPYSKTFWKEEGRGGWEKL